MNIQVIHEHSVAVYLLTGGVCIDVGCRGFQFSEVMRDLGCEVWAFDLEDMQAPEGIIFNKAAITGQRRVLYYVDTKDLQAKYISERGTIPVQSIRLVDIYAAIAMYNSKYEDVINIDVLKLDAEGSEYAILSDPEFKAVPRQISVEFHMHCHRGLHDRYYDKCMENLLKHYDPVQHELTQAHGAGWNYWNSLFIRKDLI